MARFVTFPEFLRVISQVGNRMNSAFNGGGLYGSFRDGTVLPSASNKESTFDTDVDGLMYVGYMSEDNQKQYIHYLKQTPGFVYIDVTNLNKSNLEQIFSSHISVVERDGRKYLCGQNMKRDLGLYDVQDKLQNCEIGSGVHMAKNLFHLPADPLGASSQVVFEGGHDTNIHWDLVLCIACCGFPHTANLWCDRKRNWPGQNLVREIKNSVFHLVSKPSSLGEQIQWRLSFSFAESKLMDTITGPKLATYTILKDLMNENIKLKESGVFKTYYLKTVFFWVCEKQPEHIWKMEQIGKCVFSVLNSLINGFNTGFISHFFIPEINLLLNESKAALSATVKELNEIKRNLEIEKFSSVIFANLAVIELAEVKEMHDLALLHLKNGGKGFFSDIIYMTMSDLKRLAKYISDFASMACDSVNRGLIDKTKLWHIEETLSCYYAMVSACANKIISDVKKCDKFETYHERVLSDAETRIRNIELPYGHYSHLSETYRGIAPDVTLLSKVSFVCFELLKRVKILLNNIVSPRMTDGSWDLNVLIQSAKDMLLDFRWSTKGHLNIHQLAQDGVWRFQIPFDTLVQQKHVPSLSLEGCRGDCWEKRVKAARNILFSTPAHVEFDLYKVTLKDHMVAYADCQKLECARDEVLYNLMAGWNKSATSYVIP